MTTNEILTLENERLRAEVANLRLALRGATQETAEARQDAFDAEAAIARVRHVADSWLNEDYAIEVRLALGRVYV